MGFLDKLWKGWGKSESTLPTKEKKNRNLFNSNLLSFTGIKSTQFATFCITSPTWVCISWFGINLYT